MKTFTISLVILFLAIGAQSQELFTISGENQIPQVEDTLYYTNLNDFGFDIAGTGPVTAKVWDYSSLGEDDELMFYYLDATVTEVADSFPDATIAEGSDVVAGLMFYRTGDYYFSRQGSIDNDLYMNYYNDSATIHVFPITAGDDFSYEYEGALQYISLSTWMDIVNGEIDIEADAQGTLITPRGTFENVLRVHVIETFEAQADIGTGSPVTVMSLEDDYYYWFHEDHKGPILVYGVTTTESYLKDSETTEVLRYQPIETPTQVAEVNFQEVMVSPNPAKNTLHIHGANGKNIEVYNILGSKMYSGTLSANKSSIDVSTWNSGMYLLQYTTGKTIHSIKILVK